MRKGLKKSIAALSAMVFLLQGVTVEAAKKQKEVDFGVHTPEEISAFLESSVTTTTQTVNEIDYIESLLEMSDEELISGGCSEDKVEKLRNADFNEELLELSKKDSKELGEIGYSNRQISEIKAYDGKTDALQYARQTRAAVGTLRFQYGLAGKNTTKSVMIAFEARWEGVPLFKYADCIVLAWFAVDSNNNFIKTFRNQPFEVIGQYKVGSKTENKKIGNKPSAAYAEMVFDVIRDGGTLSNVSGVMVIGPLDPGKNMSIIGVKVAYGQATQHIIGSMFSRKNIVGTSLDFELNKKYNTLIYSYQPFHYYDWGIRKEQW